MNDNLPNQIPACAIFLLARPEWFRDPNIFCRVRMVSASWLARFLSSKTFAKTEVAAITLGHKIHFRKPETFDIHSVKDLALLAHELKHVEQIEQEGIVQFYIKYFQEYRKLGYGGEISFEEVAYGLQSIVSAHLKSESNENAGILHCDSTDSHYPNQEFIRKKPISIWAQKTQHQ